MREGMDRPTQPAIYKPQHQPGVITSKCNDSSARILAVQTTQDMDLRHPQQEGNHAWNWTPT